MYIYMFMYVCMYVCMYIYTSCTSPYRYMYIYVCVYISGNVGAGSVGYDEVEPAARVHIDIYICIYICVCVCVCVQVASGTMKWNQLLEDNGGGTTRS